MPGPWNDTTDKQLLLTIFQLTATQTPKWDEVAARMGEGFTAESTRQHFQKLRKENAGAASGEKATPAKRDPKKPAAVSCKSTGKRKAKKDVSDETEDGDQDDQESPSKKPKMEVKKEVFSHDDGSDGGLL